MNASRRKLLNSNSIEEKIAGVFLVQKELESLKNETQRAELLSETMKTVTPAFLLRMCISKTSIIKRNGIYMLLYLVEIKSCSRILLGYLDVILLITSSENNNELKICLHSICQNLSHLASDLEMSTVLEKVLVYLLHQQQQHESSGSTIAYYGPLAVLEVCLQTCILFHFSSDFKGHNWCKLLRSVMMVHINASRLKGEEEFDKWLVLVFNFLKYSPSSQWTIEQDSSAGNAAGVTKPKVTSDCFAVSIISVVTTEIHLVLEELMCVYVEGREHICAFRLNQLSKANTPIHARYTRALGTFLVLCDYFDLFLELLVSTGADEDGDYDEDSGGLVTCWGDLPYDVLLKVQSTVHGAAKECLNFVPDLAKAWGAVQTALASTDMINPETAVGDVVQAEYAMVVSRLVSSLCRWGRDDERIQEGILLKMKHMVCFSAIWRADAARICNESGKTASEAATTKTVLRTSLLTSAGLGASGAEVVAGAESLTELYAHCCSTIDCAAMIKRCMEQDVFVTLVLFVADILADNQALDAEEQATGAGAHKSKGKKEGKVAALLESLALNNDMFIYHLTLLCLRALQSVSEADSLVTAALNTPVDGRHDQDPTNVFGSNSVLIGNTATLLRLLAGICAFYRPQVESLIKGERNVAVAVDRVFNNNCNHSSDSAGLYKHFVLLHEDAQKCSKLTLRMSQEAQTIRGNALIKQGQTPNMWNNQPTHEEETYVDAFTNYQQHLQGLRREGCGQIITFCRNVLTIGVK